MKNNPFPDRFFGFDIFLRKRKLLSKTEILSLIFVIIASTASFGQGMGIGTSTPASVLDVEGNAVVGATYSGTTAAPANGLLVEGTTGIGTSGPDRKLDILDAANPQLRLTYTDGTVYTDFQTTANGELYIIPSGTNIGIGLSDPIADVEIQSAASAELFVRTTNTGLDYGAVLRLAEGSNYRGGYLQYDAAGNVLIIGTHDADDQVTGTDVEAITVQRATGTIIFNENSADADFRVESNGNANMLFVDGGNDRVGIGTNAPEVKFVIENGNLDINDLNGATNITARAGAAADDGRIFTTYINTAPALVFADYDEGPQIFFRQTGTGTETAPQYESSIRMGAATSNIDFYDNNDRQAIIYSDAQALNDDGWGTGAVDYAEFMEKADHSEGISKFEVVGVKNGKITKNTTGATFLMVTATDGGIRGGIPLCDTCKVQRDQDPNWLAVAFIGQMPVLVEGTVNEGDYIIPSGKNDGKAISVSKDKITPGQFNQLIGVAMESSTEAKFEKSSYDPASDSELDRELYSLQQRKGNCHIINVAVNVNFGVPKGVINSYQQQVNSLEQKYFSQQERMIQMEKIIAELQKTLLPAGSNSAAIKK